MKIIDGVLTAPPGLGLYPFFASSKIYIRAHYEAMMPRLKPLTGLVVKVVTGTPGVGKSLFGIYMLHQILHGDFPDISSVVYRQTAAMSKAAWAYERTAGGGWQQCLVTSKVTIPSLFIHDCSRHSESIEVMETHNIVITSPRGLNQVS